MARQVLTWVAPTSVRGHSPANPAEELPMTSATRIARPKDAIALLEADHATVRSLLSQLEDTTTRAVSKRIELLRKISQEVRVHAQIEEEIFYPAYREVAVKEEDEQLFFEAAEEHQLVKVILPELERTEPGSIQFGARGKVLKDLIEHHAEEEEGEMFPRARKLLGKERLLALGEALAARKAALTGTGSNGKSRAKGR